MARSSLVCSIWQRYDFIPNIRCYQPEKSADPRLRAIFNYVILVKLFYLNKVGSDSAHPLDNAHVERTIKKGNAFLAFPSSVVDRGIEPLCQD